MKVIRKTENLNQYVNENKARDKSIGFIPTMGALHEGHISLLKKALRNDHRVIVSIFVNPTQFNDPGDLKKYPRTFEADHELLEKNGCDVLFFPSVDEIYPKGLNFELGLELKHLDKVMEGKFRPGHFEGVAQVVKRLLDIVLPDNLYMGQKDFQQFTIIQHMIQHFGIPTNLVVCRIKREKDGLAMSSRNRRLEPSIRKHANILYKTLKASRRKLKTTSPGKIEDYALKRLNIPNFKPEYFKIIDGYNLKEVINPEKHEYIVACTAVWAGEVRLIDNLIFKRNKRN